MWRRNCTSRGWVDFDFSSLAHFRISQARFQISWNSILSSFIRSNLIYAPRFNPYYTHLLQNNYSFYSIYYTLSVKLIYWYYFTILANIISVFMIKHANLLSFNYRALHERPKHTDPSVNDGLRALSEDEIAHNRTYTIWRNVKSNLR